MQEFKLPLQKSLTAGLKPRDVYALNTSMLTRCVGMKVREAGLERVSAIHDPTGLTTSWPNPQMFKGREVTVVADQTHVYEKAEGSWALTEIATPSAGGAWHFADFGTFYMLFNGESMVVRTPATVYTYNTNPTIKTGCNYRERVMWGGLASDFWTATWQALLTAETKLGYNSGMPLDFDMTGNMVFWGAIGGGDAMVWLIEPTASALPIVGPLGAGYGYDSDRPFYRDFLRRGDIGWRRMPWDGDVSCLRPVGKPVVVFGTNRVSGLNPVDTDFGLAEISNEVGIIGRGAVAGDEKEGLVFVGSDSALYLLSPALELKRLGYEGFLSGNIDSGAVVCFDAYEKEWYIGGVSGGYVLTKKGLSETVRPPSSLYRTSAGLYGTPMLVSNEADRVLVEWDTFNMSMRGIKTVVNVQVDYYGINNMRVHVACGTKVGTTPRYRTSTRDNGSGVFFSGLSGNDFQMKITGDPTPEASISDVVVRWIPLDKRFARGIMEGGAGADSTE